MLVNVEMKWNVARKCRRWCGSGRAFHAAQYNFGLGGNWAGITQNVIRYSVVNRRLIVTCSCLLYIYINTLSSRWYYLISIVFRSWVIRIGNSLLCIYFPSNVYHFRYVMDLNFRFSNSKLCHISKCLFLSFLSFVILIFYKLISLVINLSKFLTKDNNIYVYVKFIK